MNTITIALSAEDRKLLDDLMGSVTLLASVLANSQPKEVQEKIIAEATAPQAEEKPEKVDEFPFVEDETPFDPPAPEKVEPQYTEQDIRAITQRLIGPGSTKRVQAKAIVEEYAEKISAIPADKYTEVMGRLIALEKEQ